MGGKSKKQTQSSVNTNMPPAWALPLYKQGAATAQDLYNSGRGGNVYQGQRIADLGEQTQNGLKALGEAAAAFGRSGLQEQLGRPTAAQSNLTDMASGAYLKEGNPYYQERLNTAVGDMAAKVNSQMSGAGRYGSGANSNILAKNASNMMLSGLDNDYNRALQNMVDANSRIDESNQGALNSAGNYLRNWSNAAQAQMQGGKTADANDQAKLDAARQKWEDEDNRDWRRLDLLQNAAKGFSGSYGTKTTSNTTHRSNTQNPWDMVGSLSGLTRKSDFYAKENITPIGFKNGFPVYEFNYKGAKQRFRGVIAQDILRLKPKAVGKDAADGLYCVDYRQLGFEMQAVF